MLLSANECQPRLWMENPQSASQAPRQDQNEIPPSPGGDQEQLRVLQHNRTQVTQILQNCHTHQYTTGICCGIRTGM